MGWGELLGNEYFVRDDIEIVGGIFVLDLVVSKGGVWVIYGREERGCLGEVLGKV